jgi:phosphatidylserine decarboxylase
LITEYGYDVFYAITAICLLFVGASFFLLDNPYIKYALITLGIAFFLFTFYFFRDPERMSPEGAALILSPADGTVVTVKDVDENIFLHGPAVQISIFMSPLNVHVNRFPVSGTIGYFQHIPGEYFAAFEDKASLKNEQTHIGINAGTFKVFYKQIAGFIARRIVADLHVGDEAVRGKRFGMIKFGSRVDVFVPKNCDIRVRVGDKTVGGETIVAAVR